MYIEKIFQKEQKVALTNDKHADADQNRLTEVTQLIYEVILECVLAWVRSLSYHTNKIRK